MIKNTVININKNRFCFNNKRKETKKERFAKKSILGINMAGKTRRLEII